MHPVKHGHSNNLPALIALRAITNGGLKGEQLPSRIKLLNWGTNESVAGPILLDASCIEPFHANQRKLGYERVAIDFEHNTVEGSPEFNRTTEPRPVAAYGAPEIVPGEGLFLTSVEWTPAGQSSARNYEDLSPTIGFGEGKRAIFLHSAALCRNGAIYDLHFFNAAGGGANDQNQTPMSESILIPELASALQLPAGAGRIDVLNAITDLNRRVATFSAVLKDGKLVLPQVTALSAEIGGKTVAFSVADLATLSARVEKLEGEVVTQQKALGEKEKIAAIARFSAEGKVPKGSDGKEMSVEALSALDLPSINLLLANTPSTVPLHARGTKPAENQQSAKLGAAGRAAAYEKEIGLNA